jgi:hypothetical protein
MKKYIALAAIACAGASQAAVLLNEGFDNITTLAGAGWVQTNNSTAGGTTAWFQGKPGSGISAFSGVADSYIAANFNNAGFGGDVSNWLLTPVLSIDNGAAVNFALSIDSLFGDVVEVYMSTSGASSDVGISTTSTGVFTLLGTFSTAPNTDWVAESLTVGGLSGTASGRFAFRYAVTDTSVNGDYIGIDSVTVTAANAVPEPTSLALAALALVGLGLSRRRHRLP